MNGKNDWMRRMVGMIILTCGGVGGRRGGPRLEIGGEIRIGI